jgi:GH43 family beta-xylosidase
MGLSGATYLNPVYPHSFPDPFVLKHLGRYYAYSTGHAPDGRVFEIITSTDLVNWETAGGAMDPLETGEPFYWAPEVTYYNGKFYLYYSVGNEKFMTLRVAVSNRPDGGFADAGVKLTSQDFAIDAHVFRDDDGSWWMFYATDFLEYSHIGTGTVVDRMLDMFTLAGDPRPVTRAKYDWQVYDPARVEKGGVRWHTVEGPFVLKRKGTYYEMFSGGNWQNISYGVSFAVTDDINAQDEWHQFSDGETKLPLLRTVPGKVIGPGHNCAVLGPNDRELYCVYHVWKNDQRVLAIDRMGFAGGRRMFITGATSAPQPAPYGAAITLDRFDGAVSTGGQCFLATMPVRAAGGGGFGIELLAGETVAARIAIENGETSATISLFCGDDQQTAALRPDLDLSSFHGLHIEVDGRAVRCSIDNVEAEIKTLLDSDVNAVRPFGDADFRAFSLTRGFEERFETNDLIEKGWHALGSTNTDGQHLALPAGSGLSRQLPAGPFELAVNLKLEPGASGRIRCGIEIEIDGNGLKAGEKRFEYPADFDRTNFHQYRFVSRETSLSIHIDDDELGSVETGTGDELAILSEHGVIRLDMVRWTEI